MKVVFIFLSFLLCSSLCGQDCTTSLLSKKGVTLTYKTYLATGGMFKPEYTETTRLVYTVTEAKDSNGSRYSYITKTGINPQNVHQRYQKEYVLVCDGATLSIPADFYVVDTIYFSNRYPNSKDSGFYAASTLSGQLQYQFPVAVGKAQFTSSEDRMVSLLRLRSYDLIREKGQPLEENRSGYGSDRIVEITFEEKSKIDKHAVVGEEFLTTAMGTYTCQKISVNGNKNMPNTAVAVGNLFLYYHPKMGVVKLENEVLKRRLSYMELASVQE